MYRKRWAILLAILLGGIASLVSWLGDHISNLCDDNTTLFVPEDRWSIGDTTLPATILWQERETINRPIVHILSPIHGIPMSDRNVLYWQSSGSKDCTPSPVVTAIDLSTGHESWRFRPEGMEPILFLYKNNYILVNVNSITMLSNNGEVIWQHSAGEIGLDLRSITVMDIVDGAIYFPSGPILYKVSPQTGEILETIQIGNVIGVFGEYALVKIDEHTLQMVRMDTPQQGIYNLEFPTSIIQGATLNPLFPYAQLRDNILFLYFDSTSVEAYRFDNGELLWKVEKPSYGIPVLLENVLVLYSPDIGLEIRDIETGSLLGAVGLIQANVPETPTTSASSIYSTWITGRNETLIIRQIDSLELIAVQIDLSAFRR